MELNIPWVHSPFFEEELAKRKLSAELEGYARQYHQQGFLHLKNFISEEDVDGLVASLEAKDGGDFSWEDPREQNLWKKNQSVKKLAILPTIIELLTTLYGRAPIPFQTLNFKYGSRQKPHADTIHFDSMPDGFMCGAWAALEDTNTENGTLFYYPGSHRLPKIDYTDFQKKFNSNMVSNAHSDYVQFYEPLISKHMQAYSVEPTVLEAKKGDVLIWAANLVHGGMPMQNKARTRWSQVTHYYFEDCLYYTPQLSNKVAGEWFLRKIENISTGKQTWGTYNGKSVKRKRAGQYKFIVSDAAPYNWRDARYQLERVYHKFFKK